MPQCVSAEEVDCVGRPVDRRDAGAPRCRHERGDAQAAAELDDRQTDEVVGQRLGEPDTRGPELRPVRHELVDGEAGLIDERLGVGRPQDHELEPPDLEPVLDEVQSSASSPTVTPGGSPATLEIASSTPGTNASRELVSWRIVSVSPRPPRITSW